MAPMRADPARERGVALVVTLLVVALMSVLIMEFTESVQVDSHLSRNSLNALQATYLARSGINIAAGALAIDKTPNVDPSDDAENPDGWRSFVVNGCSTLPSLELPSNWRMCVRIVDESGKINFNSTRPSTLNPAQAPTECKGGNEICYREAIGRLFETFGLDGKQVESRITDYWNTTVPGPDGQGEQIPPFFDSIEEVANAFPELRSREVFDHLRRFVMAVRVRNKVVKSKLNINTMTPEACVALVGDQTSIDCNDIVAKAREKPFTNVGEALQGGAPEVGSQAFGVASNIFRIEAAASVNGIGKTIRALAVRTCTGGTATAQLQNGKLPCTLEFIDWQKEGGSELLRFADAVDGEDIDDGMTKRP